MLLSFSPTFEQEIHRKYVHSSSIAVCVVRQTPSVNKPLYHDGCPGICKLFSLNYKLFYKPKSYDSIFIIQLISCLFINGRWTQIQPTTRSTTYHTAVGLNRKTDTKEPLAQIIYNFYLGFREIETTIEGDMVPACKMGWNRLYDSNDIKNPKHTPWMVCLILIWNQSRQ